MALRQVVVEGLLLLDNISMILTQLSTDLLTNVASFLDENEKIVFGSCCMSFYKDLLLNHLRHFKNSSDFLWNYTKNEETREKFATKIRFPERQLHLQVSKSYSTPSFPFPRVSTLNIDIDKLRKYVDQIEKIQTLEMNINSVKRYSELFALPERLGIKSLELSIYGYNLLPLLPVIPSRTLETLTVRGPCLDLPPECFDVFSHLRELHLRDIECIKDVSMLVPIKILSLYWCHNITDITPLQTTHNITIEFCKGIVNYRNAFTYSHHISIKSPNPDAIIDLSSFKAVKSLTLILSEKNPVSNPLPKFLSNNLKRLTIATSITHLFPSYDHLQELTVSSAEALTTVSAFGCIPVLRLFVLNNVESLYGLGYDEDTSKRLRNRSVTISQLGKVLDFTPLNTIPIVEISHCQGLKDLGQLKDVKNLTVKYSDNVLEPSVPLNCETVTLGGEFKSNLLLFLPHVKELDVSLLRKEDLSGLETLENLERVAISNDWKEEEGSKAWEMLKQDYLKFPYDKYTNIYVKERILP